MPTLPDPQPADPKSLKQALSQELDAVSRRALEAEKTLEDARKYWNQWLFMEKECEDGHAHVSFPKEAVMKLLSILRS